MMTTWTSEYKERNLSERVKLIKNEDIKEKITELNEIMPNEWFIKEVKIKKFFKEKVLYSLLYKLNNYECQIINFHCEKSPSTINTLVLADVVTAFMGGLLAGLEHGKRKEG